MPRQWARQAGQGLAAKTCSRQHFAKRLRKAHAMSVAKKFRPSFRHQLLMAIHSASVGYCKRAGQEISAAIRLARKHPGRKGRRA
jgi:hypothetical protein